MKNHQDMALQAPPTQHFEPSRISQEEMHQGDKAASHQLFFMSYPGTRLPKFEADSSGIPTNNIQSSALNLHGTTPSTNTAVSAANGTGTLVASNSGGGSQTAALNLNETTPTTNTTVSSTSNQTSTLHAVTTHIPAPESAQAIPNNSLNPPSVQSSSATETHNKGEVLVCKSCGRNFEEKENETDDASLEKWLHSDMCGNCQKVVIGHTISNILQHPNQISTSTATHKIQEEEVNPSWCCFC